MSDETQTDQPHKGLKKGLYLFPTLFTAANIGMGFLAVMASIRGFHASFIDPNLAAGYFNMAAIGIGLAILFDTIDGRVARATKTATEIGVQFDSLADVLTFGIAPAALIYAWGFAGVFNENTSGHNIGLFLLFMYLMCGAFRLARFNVQSMRPRVLAEGSQKLDKKYFVGLPIPPAGGLLAAIVHFSPLPLSTFGENAARSYGYALMALIAVLGIMMVSRIRYASFKSAGKGRAGIMLIIFLAAGATAVFLYSQYALILIASLYVGHGIVWFFLRRIPFGRRAAAESDI